MRASRGIPPREAMMASHTRVMLWFPVASSCSQFVMPALGLRGLPETWDPLACATALLRQAQPGLVLPEPGDRRAEALVEADRPGSWEQRPEASAVSLGLPHVAAPGRTMTDLRSHPGRCRHTLGQLRDRDPGAEREVDRDGVGYLAEYRVR